MWKKLIYRERWTIFYICFAEGPEWERSHIKYNKVVRISSCPADVPRNQWEVPQERSIYITSPFPILAFSWAGRLLHKQLSYSGWWNQVSIYMYSGIAHTMEAYDLFYVTADLEVLTPFIHYCDILSRF
jgi:hypothetical protein